MQATFQNDVNFPRTKNRMENESKVKIELEEVSPSVNLWSIFFWCWKGGLTNIEAKLWFIFSFQFVLMVLDTTLTIVKNRKCA